jgi:hypothetical protein
MNANKTVSATFKSTTVTPNLVPFISWDAVMDNIGSTVTIDSSKKKTGTIGASLKTVKDTGYNSYSALGAYLDTTLTGAKKITLTYTATKKFWFGLDQDGTDGFGMNLPAASTPSTIEIPLDATTLKTPSWSAISPAPTLNLAKISAMVFDVVYDDASGNDATNDAAVNNVSGAITITSLTIDGYIGNTQTSVFVPKMVLPLSNNCIKASAGRLNLSLAKAGNYSVSLYNIDGKLVRNIAAHFNAGVNVVDMKGIAFGQYVVRIGGAASLSGRVILGN